MAIEKGEKIKASDVAPATSLTEASTKLISIGWFDLKVQKVSALPAEPDPNVIYLIKEES